MSKKQDPRTIQTKALIKQTLLEMLKKTAFYKITVSELCKIAGINRGTFYLHYCDLWAVLEELEEEALREVKNQLMPGTAMLVKASHSMHFEVLVNELQKNDD